MITRNSKRTKDSSGLGRRSRKISTVTKSASSKHDFRVVKKRAARNCLGLGSWTAAFAAVIALPDVAM